MRSVTPYRAVQPPSIKIVSPVINEAAARLWPAGADPIGARLRLGALERPPVRTVADTSRPPEVTIVGVIADTRNAGLRSDTDPALVMPYSIIAAPQRKEQPVQPRRPKRQNKRWRGRRVPLRDDESRHDPFDWCGAPKR